MKMCRIGWFSKIVTVAVLALLCIPSAVLFAYLLATDADASARDRLLYAAGIVMFGFLTAFAVYRIVVLGPTWVEYDAERVIFHYSRRESYEFCWADIPGPLVQAGPWNGGYAFTIDTGVRRRTIPVNGQSRGWWDLQRTLEDAGVFRRLGVAAEADLRRSAGAIFSQFDAYRAAHTDSFRPRPADAVPCPACAGRGIFPKRLPILKVEVGKVCRTCGGSGYVSKTGMA